MQSSFKPCISLITQTYKQQYLKLVLLIDRWLVQRSVAQERVNVVAGVEALDGVGRAVRPRAPRRHRLHVADLYIYVNNHMSVI